MSEKVFISDENYRLTSTSLTARGQSFAVDKIERVSVTDHSKEAWITVIISLAVSVGVFLVGRNTGSFVLTLLAIPLLVWTAYMLFRIVRNGTTSSLSVTLSGKKHRIYESGDKSLVTEFRDAILAAQSENKNT